MGLQNLSLLSVGLKGGKDLDLLFFPSTEILRKEAAGKISIIMKELNLTNVPSREAFYAILKEGKLVVMTKSNSFSMRSDFAKIIADNKVNSLLIQRGTEFYEFTKAHTFGALTDPIYDKIVSACKVVENVLPQAEQKIKASSIS